MTDEEWMGRAMNRGGPREPERECGRRDTDEGRR